MRICLVTPARPGSRVGNRVTALRWARLLRELGHRATIRERWDGERCDLLVALHARKSHASIMRFGALRPDAPLIVALTGTDLYADLGKSARARESVDVADALVVLQPDAVTTLPPKHRAKARSILQSAVAPPGPRRPAQGTFDVCVVGHIRPVKDPFRAALAARQLPEDSRIRILHVGAALDASAKRRARAEEKRNPRYVWLGELPRWKTLRRLKKSRLLVLTSKLEGGANVVSEAIVCGVPVLSTRISGSIGMLGRDYPGYFPVGDTEALARLLHRVETDRTFLGDLSKRCRELQPQFRPAAERKAWRELIRDIGAL